MRIIDTPDSTVLLLLLLLGLTLADRPSPDAQAVFLEEGNFVCFVIYELKWKPGGRNGMNPGQTKKINQINSFQI